MRTTFIRMAALAAIIATSVLWTACGDTYRPVITPIPQPGGDPQLQHKVVVLNTDSAGGTGALNIIDVSGDTDVGNQHVGNDPRMVLVNSGAIYSVNRGSGNLTLVTSFAPTNTPTTISLPPGSAPVFAGASGLNIYVADPANNAVQIVSSGNVNTGSVAVGSDPVALVGTPDGTKVYVANKGSNDVSVITTQNNQVLTTVPVGAAPVYAAASTDGKWIMVAEQGAGKVAVIKTSDNSVTELAAGSGPSYVTFDNTLKRFYVVNTAGNSISIYDETTQTPTFLATVGVGAAPTSVAPLSDGTRAYTANSGDGTVSVVDVKALTKTKDITVATGGQTAMWVAASADATKVYAAVKGTNATTDPGFTAIIPTAADTILTKIQPPKTDPNCNASTTTCSYTQPIYVASGQ